MTTQQSGEGNVIGGKVNAPATARQGQTLRIIQIFPSHECQTFALAAEFEQLKKLVDRLAGR